MQKGGGKKKNKEKVGFKPVEDMITSIGTKFDVLTANSLFGFMVTMDVPPKNAEYFGRSSGGSKLSNPITKYLLKLSVIDITQHYLDPIVLDLGRTYNKSCETATHFYKEAVLQQRIWLDSIIGGSVPICPDVYSISYNCGDVLFNGSRNSSSSAFKRREVVKYPQVYDYLMKYHTHNSSTKIGAIAMEYIPNSKTLYEVLFPDVDDEFKRRALITAGAQVLRLFLNHSIIHVDLHLGNILVDENGMSYIIDFGIVLDLKDERSPFYSRLMPFHIMESKARYNAYLQQRQNRKDSEINRDDNRRICIQILEELKQLETTLLRRCQMESLFEEFQTRDLFYEIMIQYKEMSSSTGHMSRQTISKKIKDGEIELITDAGLGTALAEQLPFLQPNVSDDYYVATNPIDISTVPITNQTITVPITNQTKTVPMSEFMRIGGATKKRKLRIIKKGKTVHKKK